MSKSFAVQIIDSMVDETGHCGDRGLSPNQFKALAKHLELVDEREAGSWSGDYSSVPFTEYIFEGNIGRYHVTLRDYHHFNHAYSVDAIEPWCDEVPDLSGSEWQAEPKKRLELTLTLVEKSGYAHDAYSYGGSTWTNIYTFADGAGNAYVWKTDSTPEVEVVDDAGEKHAHAIIVGDKVVLRGTVKDHDTFRDVKQTVLTRCKVLSLAR